MNVKKLKWTETRAAELDAVKYTATTALSTYTIIQNTDNIFVSKSVYDSYIPFLGTLEEAMQDVEQYHESLVLEVIEELTY